MDNNEYYGSKNPTTFTFLEFGEIDVLKGNKKTWEFQLHQKAYDWLMLGRYANDILAFETMKAALEKGDFQAAVDIYNREVHHGDEAYLCLTKLIALAAISGGDSPTSFFELGQTIFGCIEGMDFMQQLLKAMEQDDWCPDLKSVDWYGIDISDLFNLFAVRTHAAYRVKAGRQRSQFPAQMDVFFSKGITLLYAVRTIQQFRETIAAKCAVFDYSFSLGQAQDVTIGSGKMVRYLPFSDLMDHLQHFPCDIYVNKTNSFVQPDLNRVWLDLLCAEPAVGDRFVALDKAVRKKFKAGLSQFNHGQIRDLDKLVHKAQQPEWVRLTDYARQIGI